jgi:hypothetical protein
MSSGNSPRGVLPVESPALVRVQDLEPREPRFWIQGFSEQSELEELDVDFDDAGFSLLSPDVEKNRVGLRFAFGGNGARGYVQFFSEEMVSLLPGLLPDEFDLVGLGGGIQGAPSIADLGENASLVLPYRVGISLAVGIEEFRGFDEELAYLDTELEFGFGARFLGFQPSAGLYLDTLVGVYESDDPTNPSHLDTATTVTGTHVGGYGELFYKHDEFPVFAYVRAVFGEVSGAMFGFGAAF